MIEDERQILDDLNIEKRLGIREMKEIEIKLEKLKIPKTIVNIITKSVIPEKYLHPMLRPKK